MEHGSIKTLKRYLINKEIKVTFIGLMISLIIALGVFLAGLNAILCEINNKVVKQNIEIAGKLVERYPQLEDKLIETINQEATAEQIKKGTDLLSKYGYKENMSYKLQTSTISIYGEWTVKITAAFVVFAIAVFILVFLGFAKIYSQIEKITYIIQKIIDGDFSYKLKADGEECFDLFGNEFNKMSNCLKLNIDNLKREKIFLKNTIEDISHQLKTPVATLIAANDIMSVEIDMDVETRTYFIDRSKKQLERIEWLVKSLLKLAMLDAGIIAFNKAKVNLRQVIEKAAGAVEYIRESKNITIQFNENIKESYFYGDINWTCEAILNIIKNGLEHTPWNGQIVIEVQQMKLLTSITISDNGEGIEADELTKIFERFHKCRSNYKEDSVGIGLSLSKKIIDGQGGTITVQSKKGEGSSFNIIFPHGLC